MIKIFKEFFGLWLTNEIITTCWTRTKKKINASDVLKPAGWAAPALNQPRGNVLEGNYPIQWTGPLYL